MNTIAIMCFLTLLSRHTKGQQESHEGRGGGEGYDARWAELKAGWSV